MTVIDQAAVDLEVEIVRHCAGQRASWVPLAGALYRFHEQKGWAVLGAETFNEWLGQPDVGISRAEAYAMIGAWREFVVHQQLEPSVFVGLDASKVAVIVPAVRSGKVPAEEALSDCEVLSRSDLRAKYQNPSHAEYRVCETCGSRLRVDG